MHVQQQRVAEDLGGDDGGARRGGVGWREGGVGRGAGDGEGDGRADAEGGGEDLFLEQRGAVEELGAVVDVRGGGGWVSGEAGELGGFELWSG